jgi:purine-binding chemotaxis protein CheW
MEKLLSAAFARRAQADARAHRMRALHDQANETPVQVQRFVTFEVAAQEYGLEIGVVREIVPAPDHLAQVPGADAAVLGIVGLRDTLLPLLSLRALLGQPPSPQDARGAKVVVTSVGETTIGLVVDAMRAIVSADASQVEAVPQLLAARSGGEARIKAIYRGEEGRRLIPILSPEHLFRDETMRRLTEQRASAPTPAVAAHEGERQQAQFLVFRLGEDVYGLPLAAVDEVARVPEQITRLPKAPKFLEGVINLRGDVLPVIDQRRRFDMPALEHGRQRHLIVVRSDRHRAGLIVDEVSEVLRTASARLAPPPALSEDTSRLVHGVVALEQERMLIVLDPAELLTRAERGLLDAFQVETEQAPL